MKKLLQQASEEASAACWAAGELVHLRSVVLLKEEKEARVTLASLISNLCGKIVIPMIMILLFVSWLLRLGDATRYSHIPRF